jgi:energy-coupling factor transporter ATP-binding protein EcfA2
MKKIIVLLIVTALFISLGNYIASNQSSLTVVEENIVKPTPVIWHDKALEKTVRNKLSKSTGDIFTKDLDTITDLSIWGITDKKVVSYNLNDNEYTAQDGSKFYKKGEIVSIEDLKLFKNLKNLTLCNQAVVDFSPLRNLIQLENLVLTGNNIKDISPIVLHRRVAVVFQKPMMLNLTVMENLELGLGFRGVKRREREKVIEPWLEKMHLNHLAKRRARLLSGGEAQRVAIAQALMVEPEIILLDEPFANLDKKMRQELMEEIRTLLTAKKIATVMVTHHRLEAINMSSSIYYMEDGEIINREYILQNKEKLNEDNV